jgi:hypothetical protein
MFCRMRGYSDARTTVVKKPPASVFRVFPADSLVAWRSYRSFQEWMKDFTCMVSW